MKQVLLDEWLKTRIKEEEITRYMDKGRDFINEDEIEEKLARNKPDPERIDDILARSLSVETLSPDEVATLLNVDDPQIYLRMEEVAKEVKRKVYDNRIVTFAPLYLSNFCVNNCLYCGFRKDNLTVERKKVTLDKVKQETEVLAGKIGHKRLIVVYGEHPSTDIDYMCNTIHTIYSVKVKTKRGYGQIRRVNVNAPPLSIEELYRLKEVGIGTYQVFQETYHHRRYQQLHPKQTIKGNYQWRLYCMHRALEAGVDDVGIGVLFGLYDWKFEVMALVYHVHELERKFGIGPHTISFPRLEPAFNTPFSRRSPYKVSDEEFRRLVVVLRLAVPYTGMIITAREPSAIRDEIISLGCTQTDASTRIGIGAYSDRYNQQEVEKQQFLLGDTRSLEELVKSLAEKGYIVSFCTAGYRCGRTGTCIMNMLKEGKERWFCKLNAILTFREWLDDFASEEVKQIGEQLIQKEIEEVKKYLPSFYSSLLSYYERIKNGERDLYF